MQTRYGRKGPKFQPVKSKVENENIFIFTLYKAMRAQDGVLIYSTLSLTSALDGDRWKHHAPAALPPVNRSGTHCTEAYVEARAGLYVCRKPRPLTMI